MLSKISSRMFCLRNKVQCRLDQIQPLTSNARLQADCVMPQGDIGWVVSMWNYWSLMAQDIAGLSHYRLHLPRLVLLLGEDLPEPLARAIKDSMLIPVSGRAGHDIVKDFYLEIQKYWLNFFTTALYVFSFWFGFKVHELNDWFYFKRKLTI